jgi:hypothetical protein
MTTSRTSALSKPTGSGKISVGTLGYVRARNRQRAYDLVVRELKKSGITQSELARRLGKGQDAVSRLLSRPGNWELDTLSDLLFAISGSVPRFSADDPLAARPASVGVPRAKSEPKRTARAVVERD